MEFGRGKKHIIMSITMTMQNLQRTCVKINFNWAMRFDVPEYCLTIVTIVTADYIIKFYIRFGSNIKQSKVRTW